MAFCKNALVLVLCIREWHAGVCCILLKELLCGICNILCCAMMGTSSMVIVSLLDISMHVGGRVGHLCVSAFKHELHLHLDFHCGRDEVDSETITRALDFSSDDKEA